MYLDILRTVYKTRGDLHHACLIEGDKVTIIPALRAFFEKELNFATQGNPDFYVGEYTSFSIDDGRRLIESAMRKSLQGRKIFVTTFTTITHEAQNALLKLFEDPKENTHFFLITPDAHTLLGTLRSRLFLLAETQGTLDLTQRKTAHEFLTYSKKDRLAFLKGIIDAKDKDAARVFLDALTEELHTQLHAKDAGHATAGLLEVVSARHYLLDRSSSLKLLLEHVALTLPKV